MSLKYSSNSEARHASLNDHSITFREFKFDTGAPLAQNFQMGDAEGEHHFAKVTLGTRSGTVCWLIFKFVIQIRAWWLSCDVSFYAEHWHSKGQQVWIGLEERWRR